MCFAVPLPRLLISPKAEKPMGRRGINCARDPTPPTIYPTKLLHAVTTWGNQPTTTATDPFVCRGMVVEGPA